MTESMSYYDSFSRIESYQLKFLFCRYNILSFHPLFIITMPIYIYIRCYGLQTQSLRWRHVSYKNYFASYCCCDQKSLLFKRQMNFPTARDTQTQWTLLWRSHVVRFRCPPYIHGNYCPLTNAFVRNIWDVPTNWKDFRNVISTIKEDNSLSCLHDSVLRLLKSD